MKTKTESKQVPYCCPVCGGRGHVSNGFYNIHTQQWSTASTTPEQCKSCFGRGIVWCITDSALI